MLPKIITIVGPTGSGKSDLAIKLAKKNKGEIISADSRQIYDGFIIGSGLVKGKWKDGVYYSKDIPHYLVQFLEPTEKFSAAQFKKRAIKKIDEVLKKDKLPFLVGGTGLYIDAVLKNLDFPKVKPNKALRKKLSQKTTEQLFLQLSALDPQAAEDIDKKNKRRLVRAIEVCLLGNTNFSQAKSKGKKLFDSLQLGIKIPRQELYKKIDKRVDKMIEEGLIAEVESLLGLYPKKAPAFSGIGYNQVIEYLEGDLKKEEMVRKIKTATHAYARRQMTWFKRGQEINWSNNYREAERLVKKFIS